MARSLVVGAPGIRLILRAVRGEEGDDTAAGAAVEGSCDTAAMASSSVMRKLSFSTLVS